MNYSEIFKEIESKKNFHFNITPLINALNEASIDYLSLKCIHVAGTNGKGSTTNYLRSILQISLPNKKIGTFTSPYLEVHNDRIRINNFFISDDDFCNIYLQYKSIIEKYELSMFEIDMLVSLAYFINNDVDLVIYEVGLGGLLDATNVIVPIVSVITNIGFDHMDFLGNSLEEIAFAKAGIIKENIPLVTSEKSLEALEVFKKVCNEKKSEMYLTKEFKILNYDPLSFAYRNNTYQLLSKALYQVNNACLAIDTCILLRKLGYQISDQNIYDGLSKTIWQGRFEELFDGIFVDGAHNEQGVTALCDTLSKIDKKVIVVFAALKDKSVQKMLSKLENVCEDLLITSFDFYRALPIDDYDKKYNLFTDYKLAIDHALTLKDEQSIVVITGSLYFISEARNYLLTMKGDTHD